MSKNRDLKRFVDAQAAVYPAVRAELRAGAKKTHWMWFIFPQLAGLGQSAKAAYFGLDGSAEAAAYIAHPVLGPRLVECTRLVMQHAKTQQDIHDIFASPDDMKFRSSMTLFSCARPTDPVFAEVLQGIYGGEGCALTLEMLGAAGDTGPRR